MKALRDALISQVRKLPKTGVGIALSGGVDSCSLLAACLAVKLRPTILSYTPDSHESTDFKFAHQNAKALNLPFVPVYFHMNADCFEWAARRVVGLGYKTKMQVESLAPMTRIAEVAQARGITTLLTGDQADGYYINGNWISRNYDRAQGIPGPQRQHVREDEDACRIDKLRRIYWEEDRANCGAIGQVCAEYGVAAVMPYRSLRVRDLFLGLHWLQVNTPRLKEPVWQAFPEMGGSIWTREKPVNLHRGDSLFAQIMGETLMAEFPGPWKTPTGLYAAMARGEA